MNAYRCSLNYAIIVTSIHLEHDIKWYIRITSLLQILSTSYVKIWNTDQPSADSTHCIVWEYVAGNTDRDHICCEPVAISKWRSPTPSHRHTGIKNLNLKSKISHPLPNDPLHKSDTPSSGHAQMNAQISDYGIVTRKVVICTYMNTIGIPWIYESLQRYKTKYSSEDKKQNIMLL